ncbi:Hypothetical protein, putative [Bodo saltans]|uniref:Uncharacterized protein n=1 Tax=Bodo saltans TaxID=75058 RepID=A0A0S4KJT0_BODSA|nr:Hypothetical protein, putative [Bodo saltans]|eukprot:CUI14846.1 Hypothetical protein, putative [Bodo saltans]
MSHQRRRTRPLELLEHEYLDLDRPLDVELLLDEHDYRLKWPSAPLTKFLNRYLDQQLVSSRSQPQHSSSSQRASLQHQRNRDSDYVVVPHVFLDYTEEVEDEGRDDVMDGERTSEETSGSVRKRSRSEPSGGGGGRSPTTNTIMQKLSSSTSSGAGAGSTGGMCGESMPLSGGPILPPDERWDGEPHELVVFCADQLRDLTAAGFPRAYALHGHQLSPSSVGEEYIHAALWGEAGVLVTEFEVATHREHLDKTLRLLRLMPLSQAVPVTAFRASWAKGPAWVGSLTWEGVEVLHQHWLSWRKSTSNPSRPWGAALIPRLHVSLPMDNFFLSQEAVNAIATTGASGDRTTTQMLLNERKRHGVLPDFNLRLKRERREGAFKAVFGYLPYDVRKSTVWGKQETLWSMIAVGRRAVLPQDVEDLVDGLPHPGMIYGANISSAIVTPAAPTATTARGAAAAAAAAAARDAASSAHYAVAAARYSAAESMLSREMDDARRLLQLTY